MWKEGILYVYVRDIYILRIMPGKKEAEDGVSPQEAGHFALDLCRHARGHAGALWTPICPQKFSVRPQRFIFSQGILESAPQPEHGHQAGVTITNTTQMQCQMCIFQLLLHTDSRGRNSELCAFSKPCVNT